MKRFALVWIALLFGAAAYVLSGTALPVKASSGKETAVKTDRPVAEEKCFECHDEIKALKAGGRYAKVNCVSCHSGTAAHLADSDIKPATRMDLEACGVCHRDQYDSFATLNLKKPARVEKSLLTERSPNPFWDKLMMGHGFTKEHNAPRSHSFMLVDHLIVDRAYGGRFQSRNGWQYVSTTGALKAWDLLEDRYPESKEHKAFIPERSEERRVGKECRRLCRSRWSPYH
jgi:formate-dependent nitrite reductase cytochrome c552 subunit